MNVLASKRTGLIGLLVIVVVLGLLAWSGQWRHDFYARVFLPTEAAEWIWAPDQKNTHQPIAFYAAKSFEVPFDVERAELLSLADEESVLFINGEPVGATRYDEGSPLPSYDVTDLVRRGTNRAQVELRSTRGVGAFLFSLEISGAETTMRVDSDNTWRIFYHANPDVFSEDVDLPAGDRPEVWGTPPAGRWSVSGEIRPTPTIAELRVSDQAVQPSRWRRQLEDGPGDWEPLPRLDRFSPALGSWVTFDFGRQVIGYLAVRFPAEPESDRSPLGLIYVGRKSPEATDNRAEAQLVGMNGQRVWLDSEPRRCRYVTFVGLVETAGIEVYEVDENLAVNMLDIAEPAVYEPGAFGLRSTRLRTPLENEVWGEIHSLSSGARREDP